MLYNVNWATSETKKIYEATQKSEFLMQTLETSLIASNLIKLIGEDPKSEKGRQYGVLNYYYQVRPNRKLLSAAPRRNYDYIHVVIFNLLTKNQLKENGFDVGNYNDSTPDIKIYNENEIERLISLIIKHLHKI